MAMRGVVVAACVVVVMASLASAHNWIGSPSRAKFAAVTKPCQLRVDQQPHVQVAAGQEFTMEWTVGHGDFNQKWMYWVAVAEKDYDMLADITTDMIDEYILSAPTSAYLYNATKWKKVHISYPTAGPPAAQYTLQTPITAANDADFIPRDPVMSFRKNHMWQNNYNEYRFLPEHTQNDLRVAYLSAKYPWIESASRFRNSFAEHLPYAGEFDMARFTIPARQGVGNYIYFFYWGGYRDCVDINVQPTTVALPYGVANSTAPSTYVKLDHCSYYYTQDLTTQCSIVPRATMSVQQCVTACNNAWYCTGVQATRATNPSNTLAFAPQLPSLLWDSTQWSSTFPPVAIGPCGSPDMNSRTDMGCKNINPTCNLTAIKPASDDYVCFGLQPYRDQDFQAIDDYIITNDANDPRYYSTCWVRVANTGFLSIPTPVKEPSKWDNGDACLDCTFRTNALALGNYIVPKWSDGMKTSNCINCDAPTN